MFNVIEKHAVAWPPEGDGVGTILVEGANKPLVNSIWGNPIPFEKQEPPEVPASLLPGVFGEFAVALAESLEVPEAMTALGVLGVVSACCGHRFVVSPKRGWIEPTNIYVLVGLEPGNAKSPAIKKLTRPLIDWEASEAERLEPEIKRAISERKTREKVIEKMRTKAANQEDPDLLKHEIREIAEMEAELKDPPALPRVFATDTTTEQLAFNAHEQGGRFGVVSDEGGIMRVVAGLYSGGNSNIDIILKGIDGGAVRVRRKDRSFDLNPFLTFCLFCQPSVVEGMGKEGAFDGNGLVERFLYALPSSRLGYRALNTAPLPESLEESYGEAVKGLLDRYISVSEGQAEKWNLSLADNALVEFREFQVNIEVQLRPRGKLRPILGWGGKICGYALRLAGLLHVMEYGHSAREISKNTVSSALEIAALLIDHALLAFGLMGVEAGEEREKQLLEWIEIKGQARFNKRDCLRELHSRFRNSGELEQALGSLESRRFIRGPIKEETGGRPSVFYEVNPALFSEV